MSGTRVVFLRGVNLGGKTFRPTELVRTLPALRLVSIGAAGTFVSSATVADDAIRRALKRALPFETEIMICDARDVRALIDDDPFAGLPPAAGQYVTVLARRPAQLPKVPYEFPAGAWEIRLTEVRGSFVTSVRRDVPQGRYYPNEVVEKLFGMPATTRGWPTFARIARALEAAEKPAASAAKKVSRATTKRATSTRSTKRRVS